MNHPHHKQVSVPKYRQQSIVFTVSDRSEIESEYALQIADLSVTFADGTAALAHVDLRVRDGELVAVVGPSGCGKSTLLRVIAGLQNQSSGSCSTPSGGLGYVFQDATLLPWRNVRRNVELNAELQGMDKTDRRQATSAAIELVGLKDHENKFPHQLSGGMKMRCSLARSLVLDPKFFLFDEPFGSLDEITREHLNDELLALFETRRFSGLFITHSIQEAVYLSSRVLVMSGRPGRIMAEHSIDFPYPRRPEIRYSSEFAELCGRVSSDLGAAHQ